MKKHHVLFVALLAAASPFAATPASAVCVPYLCYIDLATADLATPAPGDNVGIICPNASVYEVLRADPTAPTPYTPTCNVAQWKSVVVKVNVPEECEGLATWVEYSGQPEGFTLNVGDSETNNGFAGDSGSLPEGHNAELQVLNNLVQLYNAAATPEEAETLLEANLALLDGALNVVVKDQFVSVGQPYQALSTPDLDRLFFLPTSPVLPDNRTVYVGINRVIAPINGTDTSRNGCGARRVLMTLR